MQKKIFKILISAGLILFLSGADVITPEQVSQEIDTGYQKSLDLYRQKDYSQAKEELNKILGIINSNPSVENWRQICNLGPTKEDILELVEKIEIDISRGKEAVVLPESQIQEKRERPEEEKKQKRARELALDKEELAATKETRLRERIQKQALVSAQKEEQLKELAKKKEAHLKQRAEIREKKEKEQEIKVRKEELLRERKVKREQEFKAKQERELARKQQRETQIKKQAELNAKREKELAERRQLLRTKREELALDKQVRLRKQEERKVKREQELRVRQERELARKQQREARLKKQLELQAQREALLKIKKKQLAEKQEERLRRQAELLAKRQLELKAKEDELEEERREEARLGQQMELQAKKQEELKAKEEELTNQRQREARLKKQAELQVKKEEEIRIREEELVQKREARLKEQAELLTKKQRELKTKEQALLQQRREEAQLDEKRKLQAEKDKELKLREKKLVSPQEEAQLRKQAELLAKKEEELAAREKVLLRQQLEEAQFKKLAQIKKEEIQEIDWQRQKELEEAIQSHQQKEKEITAGHKELDWERREMEAKLSTIKRSSLQEKAFAEIMLEKQSEDKAKLKRIEKLWQQARKLYEREKYEQAIDCFRRVIELEGNPRIKYSPYAKKLIEKAREKMLQKKKAENTAELEYLEGEMVNEVMKRQIPPYIEPPKSIEEKTPTPLIEPPPIRKKIKETKITMDFDKMGLKSVALFLSQESGINFVISQKVQELAPQVSARFKEASLEDVIKYIIKSLGLFYRVDKEVVWIAHPEEVVNESMETRVYYLNKGGGLFTEFSPISSGTTETGLGGSSAQVNKIYTIEDTLKEVIPWPADAKLTYDKRLNALIVRNTPQNLQMLEDILYSLDVEPCQVLIEARFLEVDITDVNELGFDWKFNENVGLKDSKKTGGPIHGFIQDSGVDFDFSDFTYSSEGLNFTYKGLLTEPQFQAVLHALSKTTKLKTLSSPRITTLNNQMASIKVVDEWIYPTRYEYEIVQSDDNGDGDFSDAGETTYKNVPKDFLRRDVGILLKVIPAVGADRKTINLSLIPEVSEGTASGFTYTGGVVLPKFTSRNLSTTVIVTSGETVVLGGLIKESRTKTIMKVPFLGDIPLLGKIFRTDADSIQRKNLLIFVTAKVLSSSGEEVVVAQK